MYQVDYLSTAIISDVNFELIELNTCLNTLVAKFFLDSSIINYTAYLLPSHDHISKDYLPSLISSLPIPFILTNNFNMHSSLWESQHCNKNAKTFEK